MRDEWYDGSQVRSRLGQEIVIFDSQTAETGEKSEQSLSQGKESMAEGRMRTKLSRFQCSCSALHRQDKLRNS
jgi:hypothetical protein